MAYAYFRRIPGRQPIGRAYSGIHYGNGRIFYWGGAHQGWPGNDLELYDCATDKWSQLYLPEWPGEFPGDITSAKALREGAAAVYGGSGTTALDWRGYPFVCHSYQQIAWSSTHGGWIVAHRPAGTFLVRPEAERVWKRIAEPLMGGDVQTHIVLPEQDALSIEVMGLTLGKPGVWRLGTTRWEKIGEPPFSEWSALYAAPSGSSWVIMAGDVVWTFTPPSTWVRSPIPLVADSIAPGPEGRILAVNHRRGMGLVTLSGSPEPYVLAGDIPEGRDGREAASPQVAYDPPRERWIYLDAWVNRNPFGGGPTQTYSIELRDSLPAPPPDPRVVEVGTGGRYASLRQAYLSGLRDGAVVRVVSDLQGGATITTRSLVVGRKDGGRRPWIRPGVEDPDIGLLVAAAPCVIEGLDISGGSPDESYGGIALRSGGVTIRDCEIHHTAMGINRSGGGRVEVVDTIIHHTGDGSGQSHGMYPGGQTLEQTLDELILTRVSSWGCDAGHCVKSRAKRTVLDGCVLGDREGGPGCSCPLELPWGGVLDIVRSEFHKLPTLEAQLGIGVAVWVIATTGSISITVMPK